MVRPLTRSFEDQKRILSEKGFLPKPQPAKVATP
jgi:hypothetical protein